MLLTCSLSKEIAVAPDTFATPMSDDSRGRSGGTDRGGWRRLCTAFELLFSL